MTTDRQPSLASYLEIAEGLQSKELVGRVTGLTGLVSAVRGVQAEQGEACVVEAASGPVMAEAVGFRGPETLIMPLGDMHGIGPGTRVRAAGHPLRLRISDGLLGQVLDGLGRPLDGTASPARGPWRSTVAAPPNPLDRARITTRLGLGIRALDAMLPCGHGQRLGIFAGSGVGKSSLLGMIARSTRAEVNVICLVGERGREVKDFLERDLGEEGLARSVVVCATSDQPALVRIKAALTATAIAEHFRDSGRQVLLMMDSITRLAMAQREVGLAAGEPPATRGYPPSVWAMLPRVLERAGATSAGGSITGLYTVLVEGDDMNEPIADATRAILDGHVVLSRRLAHRGHYPAIDVLASVSRLEGELLAPEVRQAAAHLRDTLARYSEREDMVSIGAYQPGSDPMLDYAIAKQDDISGFLRQGLSEPTGPEEADEALTALMADFPGISGPGFASGPDPLAATLGLPDSQAGAPVIPAISFGA